MAFVVVSADLPDVAHSSDMNEKIFACCDAPPTTSNAARWQEFTLINCRRISKGFTPHEKKLTLIRSPALHYLSQRREVSEAPLHVRLHNLYTIHHHSVTLMFEAIDRPHCDELACLCLHACQLSKSYLVWSRIGIQDVGGVNHRRVGVTSIDTIYVCAPCRSAATLHCILVHGHCVFGCAAVNYLRVCHQVVVNINNIGANA